jgi:hypothetical protein
MVPDKNNVFPLKSHIKGSNAVRIIFALLYKRRLKLIYFDIYIVALLLNSYDKVSNLILISTPASSHKRKHLKRNKAFGLGGLVRRHQHLMRWIILNSASMLTLNNDMKNNKN